MPIRGDPSLGFGGVAAAPVLVLLLALPVLALVLRRRWRMAAARRAEVMRLVHLAAQEAARAELESSPAYAAEPSSATPASVAAGGIGARPQCAVCFSPTTTRCSRCKAVRYCSGKCQIIHWRQGHKEECRPPQIKDHSSGQGFVSDLNGVQAEWTDMCDNSSDIERKAHVNALKAIPKSPGSSESNFSSEVFSSEDDNLEGKLLVDSSGTESTSDSSTVLSSSGCSASSGPLEVPDGTPVNTEPIIACNVILEEPSSCDNSSGTSAREADVFEINHTKLDPSELDNVSVSVNSASCSINYKQKVPSCNTEDTESRSDGSFTSNSVSPTICGNTEPCKDGISCDRTLHSNLVHSAANDDSSDPKFLERVDLTHLDAGSSLQISSKSSGQAISFDTRTYGENSCGASPSQSMTPSKLKAKTESIIVESSHVPTGRSKDLSLLNHKGSRCPSGSAPADHATVSSGEHVVSSATTAAVDTHPTVSTRLSQSIDSVPNGIDHLKTSAGKVIQQSKSYKYSRHYPSGFWSYASGKHNHKMLFPYDLFVKLYSCDKVELHPFGLINCGNSCYANAVLQCLAFTRPLTTYLLEGLHTKTCPKKKWCFTCELESLLLRAKQGKTPVSPVEILSRIDNIGSNLGHGREEDAHEFLRYAIDAMQSICLKEAGIDATSCLSEETTLIQLTFGGYLRSKIKCMRCQGKSERHERMMDLTVEIHGDIGTLEQALTRFTATEILDGENKYRCNRCKSYERAKKKLTILEAPNILTIALKRFQSGKFGKLNKAVWFPECLDLAPYMSRTDDKSPVYRLYAVVVHLDIMNAAFSGHYVCYVKDTQGKWYKIDDSTVKPVELDSVISKGAYLLLYARCSPRAPSLSRKAVSSDHKSTKSMGYGTLFSSHGGVSDSRTGSMSLFPGSTAAHQKNLSNSHRTDGISRVEMFNLFNERFLYQKADSSSDSSSLLSCSDEGSCSTESTRDSTSTEEYSEYIFGDLGFWNSPVRFSEDSDGFTYSPVSSGYWDSRTSGDSVLDFRSSSQGDSIRKKGLNYDTDMMNGERFRDRKTYESREVDLRGKGSPPILYADTSKHSRKLTEQCSSRETDWVNNPSVVKSSVTMRRSSSERTTQTFY